MPDRLITSLEAKAVSLWVSANGGQKARSTLDTMGMIPQNGIYEVAGEPLVIYGGADSPTFRYLLCSDKHEQRLIEAGLLHPKSSDKLLEGVERLDSISKIMYPNG